MTREFDGETRLLQSRPTGLDVRSGRAMRSQASSCLYNHPEEEASLMVSWFRRLLRPPVPADADEDTKRLGTTLNAIVLASVPVVAVLWMLPVSGLSGGTRAAVYGSWLVSVLVVEVVLRRGYARPAAILAVSAFWLWLTANAWLTGGVQSQVFDGYVLAILAAGMILGRRALAVSVAASVAAGAAMGVAASRGAFSTCTVDYTVRHILSTQVVIFLVVAFILDLALRGLHGALERARQENEERRRAETELAQHKQQLEDLVSRRTAELEETNNRLEREVEARREAEEVIREREALQRTILDLAPDLIFRLDAEGRIQFINSAVRSLGYEPEELIGTRMTDLIHPDDLTRMPQSCVEHRTGSRAVHDLEIRLLSRKTGVPCDHSVRCVHVALSARGVWTAGDEIVDGSAPKKEFAFTTGIARDITERKQQEAELRRYEYLVNSVDDMMAVVDRDHRYAAVNDAWCRAVGRERAEAVGKPVSEVWGQATYKQSHESSIDLCLEGEAVQREDWIDFPAIGRRYCEVRYYPFRGDKEVVTQVVVVIRDATARWQAEETLQRRAAFVVNNPAPVLQADLEGRVTLCNPAAVEVFGEDPTGLRLADILPGLDAEAVDALPEGDPLQLERPCADRTFLFTVRRHESTRSYYVYGADITARKRAEENLARRIRWAEGLQKAGEQLAACRTIDELTKVAVQVPGELMDVRLTTLCVCRGKDGGRALAASGPEGAAAECELQRGCAAECAATGQPRFVPDVAAARPDECCAASAGEFDCGSCATFPITAGGECVATLTIRCPHTGEDSMPIQAAPLLEVFCRQVGYVWERCRAEEELRKLSRAIEASPASVVITDKDGNIEYVNPKFTEVTGYTREEALGQNPRILSSGAQSPEFYREMWETLTAGKEWNGDFENKRKDGRHYWEHASISPLRNAQGEITHYVAVKEDVTERRKWEQELQEATRAAEAANRAKSVFLANMSHEIRTPLNAILGFAQLMVRDASLPESLRPHLETINRSGEHLLALINDILEMSKIEAGRITLNPVRFDLHALLDDMAMMFRVRTDAKGLTLELHRAEDVPRYVVADEGKLRQVLINLLGNAVKFTDRGGITLRVRKQTRDQGQVIVSMAVEDTGVGISEEEQTKLFQPFQQTESGVRAQQGTGLGLAISREFVRMMGGELTVESEVGQGSVFRFELAVEVVAEPVEHRESAAAGRVVGLEEGEAPRRILVVDDQPANRKLLVVLLANTGLETREAENGREAVSAFESWRPDLILMDVAMPVMDGYEATRIIRSKPGGDAVKIVAVTAKAFEEDRQAALASGADGFIAKPFHPEDIFECIGTQLGLRLRRAAGASADRTATGEALTAETLAAAVPAGLLQELRKALVVSDFDRLSELADEVETHDAQAADTLRELIGQFDYDSLAKLFSTGDESE